MARFKVLGGSLRLGLFPPLTLSFPLPTEMQPDAWRMHHRHLPWDDLMKFQCPFKGCLGCSLRVTCTMCPLAWPGNHGTPLSARSQLSCTLKPMFVILPTSVHVPASPFLPLHQAPCPPYCHTCHLSPLHMSLTI